MGARPGSSDDHGDLYGLETLSTLRAQIRCGTNGRRLETAGARGALWEVDCVTDLASVG